MGCGKSSIGKELSTLLSLPVVDLDTYIENSAGRTIPDIFSSYGEAAFRDMELSALHRLLLPQTADPQHLHHGRDNMDAGGPDAPDTPDNFILSLGGGTLTTPECAVLVHERTFCIYLRASIDTLVENLRDGISGRPMLSSVRTASPIRTEAHGTPHADSSPIFHGAEPCPPESSSRSVQDGTDRPLRDRIESLMSCRSRVYESTARLTVDIDGKSYPAIASEIVSRL